MWMSGDKYPVDALYYGVNGLKSSDPSGDFQIIIGKPDLDREEYKGFRRVISKDELSSDALQVAERYSGLGDFDAHPTVKQIEERLLQIGKEESV